ncbi:MAG: hypothetical protein J6C44_02830 [Muribaculaceae bacterium]|nr:hypothetical protein [Muribaculaceae bacterium]
MNNKLIIQAIVVVAGGALAWLGYKLGETDLQKWMLATVTFVNFIIAAVTLLMGANATDRRSGFNVRVLTMFILLITLIMNGIFSFYKFRAVAFVIPNVILMVILFGSVTSLLRAGSDLEK